MWCVDLNFQCLQLPASKDLSKHGTWDPLWHFLSRSVIITRKDNFPHVIRVESLLPLKSVLVYRKDAALVYKKPWVISSDVRKSEPFKNLTFEFHAVIWKLEKPWGKKKRKLTFPNLEFFSFCIFFFPF